MPLYPSCNNTYIQIVSPLPEFLATPQALALMYSFSPKPLFLFSHLPFFLNSQISTY